MQSQAELPQFETPGPNYGRSYAYRMQNYQTENSDSKMSLHHRMDMLDNDQNNYTDTQSEGDEVGFIALLVDMRSI